METQTALTRLVRRYGAERGALLFGEYCLLATLGFEHFRERHTESQLRAIAEALEPLGLWPESAPEFLESDADDPLCRVAESLRAPAMSLVVGMDLYVACVAWAAHQGDTALTGWFEPSRLALAETLGFLPPELALVPGPDLPTTGYRLKVAGHVAEEGDAYPGQALVLGPEDGPPPPLPYAWTPDPAQPGWVTWVPEGVEVDLPEDLPRLNWLQAIARHLGARLPRHASKLLVPNQVQALLREAEAGGYDHELERYVSVPELRFAFQALLDQGVPLRPMPVILEGLIQHVLKDLAGRQLGMDEVERLNRQLPLYPTARLTAIARKSLGLPETPPPRMAWPAPPGPAPLEAPAISDKARERYRALAALMAEEVSAWRFLAGVFRATALERAERRRLARHGHSLAVPPAPMGVLNRLHDLKLIDRAWGCVKRTRLLARSLAEIAAWLDDPSAPLSPAALRALDAPRFETWAWQLKEPSRLIAMSGLESAFAAFRETEPPAPAWV